MKKLMIAVSAIALAIGANASTIDWKTAAVYHMNDTDKIAEGSLGYLVVGGTKAAIYQALAGVGADAASTWIGNNAVEGLDKTASSANKFVALTDGVTYAAGTYDVFAVIFDTSAIDDKSNVFVAQLSGQEVPTSGGLTANFTSSALADAKTAGGWQQVGAIPEPTSGLLLLLGVAGLALRRRRA